MANPSESNSRERFGAFYEEWLVVQQALLNQLLLFSALPPENVEKVDVRERRRALIDQSQSHHQRSFEERNDIASDDVFVVLSLPWLSSFQRTCLWIGGLKPTLILHLVESAVGDIYMHIQSFECLISLSSSRREAQGPQYNGQEYVRAFSQRMVPNGLPNVARPNVRFIIDSVFGNHR